MHPSVIAAALRAALSGVATGGAVGAGARFLSGGKKADILRSALAGAGLGGAVAGTSQLVGGGIMGAPKDDEEGGYARRGFVGGGLEGGAMGGILGALAASGKFPKMPSGTPKILQKGLGALKEELPFFDNALVRKFREWGSKPSLGGIRKGALLGAAGVGIPAAAMGWDEGQTVDALVAEYQKQNALRRYLEDVI